MMKQPVSKSLKDAPQDQCFWVNNGPVLRNLSELERALRGGGITDEQFRYHISRGKNDFSMWIGGVLNDERCARSLSRVKTKKTALRVLSEYLRNFR